VAFNKRSPVYLLYALEHFAGLSTFTIYFIYFTQIIGLSNADALLLDTVLMAVNLLLQIPTGIIADKLGSKAAYLIGGGFLISGLSVYILTSKYELLFVGSILFGIGASFKTGSFDSIAIHLFTKELPKLYKTRYLFESLIGLIVPSLVLFIAMSVSYKAVYLLEIVIRVIIFFIAFKYLPEYRERKKSKGNIFTDRNWFKYIKKRKPLTILAFACFIYGIGAVVINSFSGKLILLSVGGEAAQLVLFLIGAVGVAGSLYARRVNNIKFAYWFTFLIGSLFYGAAGLFIGNGVFAVLMVIKSFFFAIQQISSDIVTMSMIKRHRATIISFYTMIVIIGSIIGTLIFGTIADKSGYAIVWIISGLLFTVTAIMQYFIQSLIK